MVIDVEPCKECRENYLKNGVLIVEANQTDKGIIPTGKIAVITVEAFTRGVDLNVPARHIAFGEPGLLDKMGIK